MLPSRFGCLSYEDLKNGPVCDSAWVFEMLLEAGLGFGKTFGPADGLAAMVELGLVPAKGPEAREARKRLSRAIQGLQTAGFVRIVDPNQFRTRYRWAADYEDEGLVLPFVQNLLNQARIDVDRGDAHRSEQLLRKVEYGTAEIHHPRVRDFVLELFDLGLNFTVLSGFGLVPLVRSAFGLQEETSQDVDRRDCETLLAYQRRDIVKLTEALPAYVFDIRRRCC